MSPDLSLATVPADVTPRATGSKPRLGDVLATWSTELQIFIGMAVLAAIFSILFPDSFPTTATFMNMARVAGILLGRIVAKLPGAEATYQAILEHALP